MTWYRVDDGFPDHPKLEWLEKDPMAHALAVAAWTLMGADCAKRRTDGRFTEERLRRVLPWPEKMVSKARDSLLSEACGLWKRADDHLVFHDWEDYQPTKVELDAERKAATERQKRWRQNRRKERINGIRDGDVDASTNGVTDAVTHGVSRRENARDGTPSPSDAVDALVTAPRPVPSRSSPSESVTLASDPGLPSASMVSLLVTGFAAAYEANGKAPPRETRSLTWRGWHDLAVFVEGQARVAGWPPEEVAQELSVRFFRSRKARAGGYPITFLAANPLEFWEAA